MKVVYINNKTGRRVSKGQPNANRYIHIDIVH